MSINNSDIILINENLDFLKTSLDSYRINDWAINDDCINGPWVPSNQKSDGLTIGELVSFLLEATKQDTLAISETLSFLMSKQTSEGVKVLESVLFECFTEKTEEVTLSESLTFILISGTEINGSPINEAII